MELSGEIWISAPNRDIKKIPAFEIPHFVVKVAEFVKFVAKVRGPVLTAASYSILTSIKLSSWETTIPFRNRMYSGEVIFRFRSKIGERQATINDISSRQKVTYEIKIVAIGLVVGKIIIASA
ncbi:hypothetical protein AVEN_28171-1 [Araneus ventricosus]|uniref:Uncharacterized protein n=1 Tax=Araneus ventricosus TaxID=182803 RepID=A0A4Y2VI29_ARAVE|nr:hypothetical protein AVEN_232364-1 [Araneus ventricosus]GBO24967.1 hypothetical protein AVEN_28171-1 [Araneus ventricosus]